MSEKELAAVFTAAHLERTLPSIREPLFTAADQVLADADRRDWNLIVGDDTNGRLPTYFIRHALRRVTGRRTDTVFVNASRAMRGQVTPARYGDYFAMTLDPARTYRPLIVTEAVKSAASIWAIRDGLVAGADCETVDAASVIARTTRPDFLRYVGADSGPVLHDVFFCLEAIAGTSLRARTITGIRRLVPQSVKDALPQALHPIGRSKTPTSVLTGLSTPPDAVVPVSEADRVHALGVAYGALDPLLDEYVATRGGEMTSVIMEEYETI